MKAVRGQVRERLRKKRSGGGGGLEARQKQTEGIRP